MSIHSTHTEAPTQRWVTWLRLVMLLFAIGYLVGRISLLLHELVGHGAVALALGADVVDYRVFMFGGGYISYTNVGHLSQAGLLAISCGGIAIEVVFALVCFGIRTRQEHGSLRYLILTCFGWLNLVHALFYLAAGTFHGYGDGRLLHELLSDNTRYAVVIAVASICVIASFSAARSIGAQMKDRVLITGRFRSWLFVTTALVGAAGIHGALTFAEQQRVNDRAYQTTMSTQQKRQALRDTQAIEATLRARMPRKPNQRDLVRLRTRVDQAYRQALDRHREFPFRWLLAGLLLPAICLGGIIAQPSGTRSPLPGATYITALTGVGLVIAIAASSL